MSLTGLPLLDVIAAAKARDEGMARAAENSGDFMALALFEIGRLPPGEYLGEDVRAVLLKNGIVPERHQAYGAMINAAIKRGLLIPTGRFEQTKSVATHRHRTQVLERRAA